jgi:hypothetical protein
VNPLPWGRCAAHEPRTRHTHLIGQLSAAFDFDGTLTRGDTHVAGPGLGWWQHGRYFGARLGCLAMRFIKRPTTRPSKASVQQHAERGAVVFADSWTARWPLYDLLDNHVRGGGAAGHQQRQGIAAGCISARLISVPRSVASQSSALTP